MGRNSTSIGRMVALDQNSSTYTVPVTADLACQEQLYYAQLLGTANFAYHYKGCHKVVTQL